MLNIVNTINVGSKWKFSSNQNAMYLDLGLIYDQSQSYLWRELDHKSLSYYIAVNLHLRSKWAARMLHRLDWTKAFIYHVYTISK